MELSLFTIKFKDFNINRPRYVLVMCNSVHNGAYAAGATAGASDNKRLNVARPPHLPTAFAVRPVVDLPLGSLTGSVFSFHFRSLRITVPHTSRA